MYEKHLIKLTEIHEDTIALAEMVKAQSWTLKGIVAVTRGGMIPAGLLSHLLNLKHIETIGLSSYEQQDQKEINVVSDLNLDNDGEGWLIVDDLVDKGTSYAFLRKKFPKAHFVTLYAKPKGQDQTDLFVKKFEQNTWLDFPWEIE